MSESPVNSTEAKETEAKETKVATALPEHTDLENGDKGIVTQANPLARELKGRHMQMIAIGLCSLSQIGSHSGADISRWCNRCWFVCWFW
jgi:amino acid permease